MHNKKNEIPDCNKCRKHRVALIPENYLVYSIIEKYNDFFVDGMGGINVSSIKEIVKLYELDKEEQLITIKLILVFYKILKKGVGDKTDGN